MGGRSRRLGVVVAGLLVALLVPAAPASADSERAAEWHLAYLDISRVQQITQGDGVTVAVIDTGVDGNHSDLVGNVLPGTTSVPGRLANGWDDRLGHGTGMASLIAGHGHNGGDGILGIAPRVKVFPIQVKLGAHVLEANPDDMAAGIDAAVQQGAKVISMSIGGGDSTAIEAAVMRAQQAGVVLVAAVGNDVVSVGFPARYDGVVAVGAVDRNGNHASFSVAGRQVLISAPGVDIESASAGDQYATGSGTSASTAIVAGVVALIRAKFPNIPATEVIHRLTATATDKGPKGRDDQYGYGIVNPYAALTADVPPLAASPSQSPPAQSQTPPAHTNRTGLIIATAAAALAVIVVAIVLLTRRRATA